jgi:DNA-binding response OmpR family regulator
MASDSNNVLLVVEDEPFSRELLVRRLLAKGLHAEGMENGEACLRRLEEEPEPDLILLDMSMPGLSGIDVLHQVRARWSHDQLPVIMVSALGDSDDIVAGLEAGANDYVVKPVNMPVLLARIRVCLAIKNGVEQLVDAERQRVMIESLGAACHHIAQPMTPILATLEGLMKDPPTDRQAYQKQLGEVLDWARNVATVLHKLQRLITYRTVPYAAGRNIIDISAADTAHGLLGASASPSPGWH